MQAIGLPVLHAPPSRCPDVILGECRACRPPYATPGGRSLGTKSRRPGRGRRAGLQAALGRRAPCRIRWRRRPPERGVGQ